MKPKRQPRGASRRPQTPIADERGERLHKVLAAAGVASRRECEVLISEGRVQVDKKTITRLGTRVDPMRQEIRVDGSVIAHSRRTYFLVNKPVGVVSTNRDPQGRPRVVDLVPDVSRLFTVGRLDRSSEGLILVTNDGELANRLTHPRYGIPKTYRARVDGHPTAELLRRLRKGIHLADGVARVASIHIKKRQSHTTELEIVLTEGRNREIRRILARIGHKVLQLRRIGMGPLRLGHLAVGSCRPLSADEARQLRRFAKQLHAGGKPREHADAAESAERQPRAGVKKSPRKPKRVPQGKRGVQKNPRQTTRTASSGSGVKKLSTQPRRGIVLDYDGETEASKTDKPAKRVPRKHSSRPTKARPNKSSSPKGTKGGKGTRGAKRAKGPRGAKGAKGTRGAKGTKGHRKRKGHR